MNTKTHRLLFIIIFLTLSFVSIRSSAQTEDEFLDEETNGSIEEPTADFYMIIAGTSSDHAALELFAKDLALKTGLQYDDMGRVYQDSCVILPKDDQDEIYAGTYIFRRWDTDAISIEMNIDGIFFSPSEETDRPKMMIVAGMSSDKKEALEKLALVKKYVPTAYLKKKENVYMGCIH